MTPYIQPTTETPFSTENKLLLADLKTCRTNARFLNDGHLLSSHDLETILEAIADIQKRLSALEKSS